MKRLCLQMRFVATTITVAMLYTLSSAPNFSVHTRFFGRGSHHLLLCVADLGRNAQVTSFLPGPWFNKFAISEGDRGPIGCFALGRLYLAVETKVKANAKVKKAKTFGIIWMDTVNRTWVLKFSSPTPIINIQFVAADNTLLIHTLEGETKIAAAIHQLQTTVYRVPLKKPEPLSKLAWFSLLRLMNKMKKVDPYAEAVKFLPYTSDIQCPFET